MNKLSNLTRGIIKENPVLVLLLGTCPTLAVSTQSKNAIGMGLAAMVVLTCSNIAISALRKIIPDKVRIPAYIVVIAGFVTIVQMVVRAYAPALDKSLGIYLPLIVVNCIILGRAEMFASKNGVVDSALDGIGMGLGFTLALLLMATIRETTGAGSWMGLRLISEDASAISIMGLAPGGFFVYGLLIALVNKLTKGKAIKKKEFGCAGCSSDEAGGEEAKGAC